MGKGKWRQSSAVAIPLDWGGVEPPACIPEGCPDLWEPLCMAWPWLLWGHGVMGASGWLPSTSQEFFLCGCWHSGELLESSRATTAPQGWCGELQALRLLPCPVWKRGAATMPQQRGACVLGKRVWGAPGDPPGPALPSRLHPSRARCQGALGSPRGALGKAEAARQPRSREGW